MSHHLDSSSYKEYRRQVKGGVCWLDTVHNHRPPKNTFGVKRVKRLTKRPRICTSLKKWRRSWFPGNETQSRLNLHRMGKWSLSIRTTVGPCFSSILPKTGGRLTSFRKRSTASCQWRSDYPKNGRGAQLRLLSSGPRVWSKYEIWGHRGTVVEDEYFPDLVSTPRRLWVRRTSLDPSRIYGYCRFPREYSGQDMSCKKWSISDCRS